MKYVVAVSGGVDSVVLLDMLVKSGVESSITAKQLVVAHFDHGIRPESDADARFVWELAKQYRLPCEVRREELGENASEALARERRYEFLRDVAKKYDAKIVTAHHEDDLIETIAINIQRGTGWRGLAVFGDETIIRPLVGKRKSELYEYALKHSLEWVEDETNANDEYQRNKIRRKMTGLSQLARVKLLELHASQRELGRSIEQESSNYNDITSRYFFIMIAEEVALELLRKQTNARLTRPQLLGLLHAIKTMRPGGVIEAGAQITVRFTRRDFIVENTGRML